MIVTLSWLYDLNSSRKFQMICADRPLLTEPHIKDFFGTNMKENIHLIYTAYILDTKNKNWEKHKKRINKYVHHYLFLYSQSLLCTGCPNTCQFSLRCSLFSYLLCVFSEHSKLTTSASMSTSKASKIPNILIKT